MFMLYTNNSLSTQIAGLCKAEDCFRLSFI